jgi:tetratricopeptide (TPR) repeat protein
MIDPALGTAIGLVCTATASASLAGMAVDMLGNVALGVLGNEAHHQLRHRLPEFYARFTRERLPLDSDLARAERTALKNALLSFAAGLQATTDRTPTRFAQARAYLRRGPRFESDQAALQRTGEALWVNSFRAAVDNEALFAELSVVSPATARQLLRATVDSAAQITLHAAVQEWTERHLASTNGWPQGWQECLHDGWNLSADGNQRVTLYQAWCLHFSQAIKHQPDVFRLFVATQLADLLPTGVAEKVDDQAIQFWLAERVAPVDAALERIESALTRVEAKQDEMLTVLRDRHSNASSDRLPFDELPAPPAHFVGRDAERSAVAEMLIQDRPDTSVAVAVISVGIQGMGGVGKTALAIVVGHALKSHFTGGQVFFALGANSAQPQTGVLARRRWVQRQLAPGTHLPEDENSLTGMYRARLAEAPGPVLVLVDDPGSSNDLSALQPRAGDGLLVTSRRAVHGLNVVALHALPLAAAHALLRNVSRRELTDAEVQALAERCAFLPVALRAAGSFLARRVSKPVDEYLADLRRDRLDQLSRVGADDSGLDVFTVLAYSLRDLTERERHALLALCVMPTGFSRDLGAAVAESDGDVLDTLMEAGLLEYDTQAARFNLHDLMRETTIRANGSAIEMALEAAALRHARATIALTRRCDDAYLAGGASVVQALDAFDLERRHIDHAFHWLASRPTFDADLVALVDAALVLADLRLPAHERMRWLQAVLNAARRTGDRRSEGNYLNNVGVAYTHLREPERAIEHYEAALTISREFGDRRGESKRLGNLGNAYRSVGNPAKAFGYHEAALKICRDIGDRRGESECLGNLGLIHLQLGNPPGAIAHHEAALAIMREIGHRQGEAVELGNLGNAFATLDDLPRAIDLREAALQISREIKDRRSEASTLKNLALDYERLGNVPKALQLWQDCRKAHEANADPRADEARASIERLQKLHGR